MTREEAIKYLEQHAFIDDEVKDMCIESLEKQIPKKPMEVITEDNEFICMICPSCQEIAVEFNDRFCKHCGQALDWSDNNED